MLLVAPVKEERRTPLPANYHSLPLWDKLYHQRSDIQSVTHLDFSARIQTVNQQTNARYYALLQAFKQSTGYGLLVNTSFNIRGEPIVCTPADAYRCFMSTDMDYLVINDYLMAKTEQPDWQNKDKWLVTFDLD
jgi:carbamoyltransferase